MVDITERAEKRPKWQPETAEFLWLVLKKMTREAVHVCGKGLSQ